MKPMSISAERPVSIIVETMDGRAYPADSKAAAVDAMRADAWGCPGHMTRRAYMRRVSERAMQWCKAFVSAENAEDFIADMERAGLLTVRTVQ